MPIQQDLGLVLVVSTICSSLFLARILRLAVRGAGNARDRERSRSPWPPRASPGSRSIPVSSCSSVFALTPPLCSICISRGTSKTNSLRNTSGRVRHLVDRRSPALRKARCFSRKVGVQGVTRAMDVAAYNRTLQIGGAPPERLEEPLTQSQDIPATRANGDCAQDRKDSDETDVAQSVGSDAEGTNSQALSLAIPPRSNRLHARRPPHPR